MNSARPLAARGRTASREIADAVRSLRRHVGFSLGSAALLGLAAGALFALGGLARSVLYSPWPYQGADRLMVFRARFPALAADEWPTFSAREVEGLRALPAFDAWTVGQARGVTARIDGAPAQRLRGAAVSASTFAMLGVQPLLGRALTAEDERAGASPVAVLSYRLWQGRYGGDPTVVGRVVTLDGRAVSVVGVMPESFVWWDRELWTPLGADALPADRDQRSLYVQARRAPGVGVAEAQAQLDAWARRTEVERGAERPEYRGWRIVVSPLLDEVVRDARPALLALTWAGGGLLLLACANLANLLLRRSLGRLRDFAVRRALGASAGSLARAVMLEAALLGSAGIAAGAVLAWPLERLLAERLPFGYIPAEARIGLDLATLVAGATLVFAAVLAAGGIAALPLLVSRRFEALRVRGDGAAAGGGSRRARQVLAAVQAALAFAVVLVALQLSRGLAEVLRRPTGFVAEGVTTARVDLALRRAAAAPDQTFVDRLLRDLRASPEVAAAGVATALPLAGIESRSFRLESAAAAGGALLPDADYAAVSPDYLAALGAHLLRGRDFGAGDARDAAPVAIVNRAFAERFLPGREILGQRLRFPADAVGAWRIVVGVVDDIRQRGALAPVRQQVFVPFAQAEPAPANFSVAVRARHDSALMAPALAHAVAAIDPRVPVYLQESLADAVERDLGARRFAAWLLVPLAGAALLLASLGLYAVLTLELAERRRELAVRVAVGAGPAALARTVTRPGIAVAAAGMTGGAPLAWGLLHVLGPELAGTAGSSLAALALACSVLALAALAATLPPAMRAARVDAQEVLRGA